MNPPRVTLNLEARPGPYQPGDVLRGQYEVGVLHSSEVKAIELSVLWHTMGQGEEDLAVHYFERLAGEEGDVLDLRAPHSFETTLPNSPLSYDGVIVKICWCVRLRVFLGRGRDVLTERAFRLGGVPPAKMLE
jgi:hypothetical protein